MLRVTALELPARWGEPRAGLADADRLLTRGPDTDLVLLPEASLTWYVSPLLTADLRPFAETLEGPTASRLAKLSRKHRVHLVGPLVLGEGEYVYNAMVAFAPDGRLATAYRKRHPWYLEAWATPGPGPLGAFEVNGTRIAIAVCFDIQFVAEESAKDLSAADVLLFPSAWVERTDSRPTTLARIARTFDVAIVNANWGPGKPAIWGQGGSRIVARDGALLACAEPNASAQRIDARLEVRSVPCST